MYITLNVQCKIIRALEVKCLIILAKGGLFSEKMGRSEIMGEILIRLSLKF